MESDISAIVVKLDASMNELKKLARTTYGADKEKMTDIILDMRWNLAKALTCIGKSEDADKN